MDEHTWAERGIKRGADAVPSQDSFLGRAVRQVERGDFAAAEATCKAILAFDPAQPYAQSLLGLALGAQGQTDAAARWLDRAARARPSEPHPCHALAGLLEMAGRTGAIARSYRACLRFAPHDVGLSHALAEHLHDAGDPAGALAALRPVLLAARAPLASLVLAGMAQSDTGDGLAAIETFRTAVARDPGAAAAWSNLGVLLAVEGDFDEALAAGDRAVRLAPEQPQYRLNRAITKLRAGLLAEAWDDYDARLELPGRAPMAPERLLRDLDQLAPDGGDTVLVLHDCGFGDTLHFIRFAGDLARRGARVVAWMPSELTSLVARVPGVAAVASAGEPAPPHDWHCHATDLPRICRATLATISSAPYLPADPRRVSHWADRLDAALGRRTGLRVGLAWAGQARPWMPGFDVVDGRRSTTLSAFAPLAPVAGAAFVSLQKGPPAAQARMPPPGLTLFDPMAEVTDFADTAALVANLDAVVTVDTSVAHLAGGSGARVLLLNRYDGCWRWFHGREDSPWYAGMTVLTQDRPGDWQTAISRAAALLAAPRRARWGRTATSVTG